MVPSWADQLLPQLLMEQFDTLPTQYRHIEHMHVGVRLKKKMTNLPLLALFPLIWILYMLG